MKKLLFLLIACCIGIVSTAQQFSKKYPVKSKNLLFHPNNMIFNADFIIDKASKQQIVDAKYLTSDEWDLAIALTNLKYYPPAINSIAKLNQEHKMANYNAYIVAKWSEYHHVDYFFRQLYLVWIPLEENKHMPTDYIPITPEGFFVVCNANDVYDFAPLPASAEQIQTIVQKLKAANLPEEKIPNLYENFSSTSGLYLGMFYSAMKGLKLVPEEMSLISQFAVNDTWPDSINTKNGNRRTINKLNNYKYYFMGEFPFYYGPIALYWMPADQAFEKGYKPKNDLGIFFTVRVADEPKVNFPDKQNNLYYNSAKYINDYGENKYLREQSGNLQSPYYYYSSRFLGYSRANRDKFLYPSMNMYYAGSTPKYEAETTTSSSPSPSKPPVEKRKNDTYYLYAELHKATVIVNSDFQTYQLVYALVYGPKGLTEDEIKSTIDMRKFKSFGTKVMDSDWVVCGASPCYDKLPFVGRYNNVSRMDAGRYTYRGN